MACLLGLALFSSCAQAALEVPDARELIRRSLEAGERNELALRTYVARTRSVSKQLDPEGKVKSEDIKTYDDVVVDGIHVRKLVEKDDKPLDPADLTKENERVAKLVATRRHESPAQRDQRLSDANAKREKNRNFTHEILGAFDFRVLREEIVSGRKAWVLQAVAHPGYRPKELKSQIFPHVRGTIWVDQDEFFWQKAEADAVEPFSVGFSLAVKVDQGAHIFFEQTRLEDGTWVVRQVALKANLRLALVKRVSIEHVTTSTNWRKISSNAPVIESKEER
ncbi:MAG: hypothetical protein M3Z09_11485 [Acidobacteriota bacterium]|nr:hypothetical protein [Acidobacteriota bacterium]